MWWRVNQQEDGQEEQQRHPFIPRPRPNVAFLAQDSVGCFHCSITNHAGLFGEKIESVLCPSSRLKQSLECAGVIDSTDKNRITFQTFFGINTRKLSWKMVVFVYLGAYWHLMDSSSQCQASQCQNFIFIYILNQRLSNGTYKQVRHI